jgi:hypothetical protein
VIRKVTTIGLAVFSTIAAAQELPAQTREEFRLIAAAHRNLTRYELAVDVRYDSAKNVAPLHAEVKCVEPDRCLRSFGSLNILQTPRWLIAIDDGKGTITVARQSADVAAGKKLDLDPDKLLNAWLQKGARVSGGELSASGRHWVFEPAKSDGPKAELYTDPGSHLLRRFIYQVTDPNAGTNRVDISYSWSDTSGLTQRDFDEARYIVERGDTIIPADSYAGYKIIRADRH